MVLLSSSSALDSAAIPSRRYQQGRSSAAASRRCHFHYARRLSRNVVTMITFALIFAQIQFTIGISLFYGATSRQWPAEFQSPLGILQGKSFPNNELFEQNDLDEFTKNDYKGVYEFCKMLPLLQKLGKVKHGEHTRVICSQLIELLRPMYPEMIEERNGAVAKTLGEAPLRA